MFKIGIVVSFIIFPVASDESFVTVRRGDMKECMIGYITTDGRIVHDCDEGVPCDYKRGCRCDIE